MEWLEKFFSDHAVLSFWKTGSSSACFLGAFFLHQNAVKLIEEIHLQLFFVALWFWSWLCVLRHSTSKRGSYLSFACVNLTECFQNSEFPLWELGSVVSVRNVSSKMCCFVWTCYDWSQHFASTWVTSVAAFFNISPQTSRCNITYRALHHPQILQSLLQWNVFSHHCLA